MVSDKASIFTYFIPCGKTFSLVSRSRLHVKVRYLGHIFQKNACSRGICVSQADLVLSNPFPNKLLFFTCLHYKSFEYTMGKVEIARNEQFLHFPQCFLPLWRTFCHFHLIQNCHLQTLSVW